MEKQKKGFATMTPERRAEIAGMGGKAAHALGRAHRFTSAQAQAAALKRHQRKVGSTETI